MSRYLNATIEKMEENSINECDMHRKGLSPENAKQIAGLLKRNTSIKDLNLGVNNIDNEGAIAIGDALRENKTLESELTSRGVASNIAQGAIVKGNALKCELTSRGIDKNIGNEDAIAVGSALGENKALVKLDLNDKRLISIAESLKENFSQTKLQLVCPLIESFNVFTEEGVTALLDTLDVNMTLSDVYMDYTDVSDELRELVKKKIERNKSLNAKLEEFNVSDLQGKFVSFRKTKIILLGISGSGKTHTVRELTSEEYVEERDRYTEALEINCVDSMTWEKDDGLNAQELSLASLRGKLVAEEVRSLINEGGNEQVEENREERRVLDIEEEENVSQWSSCASHYRSLIKDIKDKKDGEKEKNSLSDPHKAKDSVEHTIVADIYDFGGHEVYRVVSQFFMNDWAVYLIVLNLEDSLDELREQLNYYVSVVQTFAPEARICVVGTHSATRSVEKDEIEKILEDVSGEADCPVFLVENGGKDTGEEGENDKERFKVTVKAIIENMMQEKRPTVPLLWTRMLDHLKRKRENEGVQVVSKEELREIELGRAFDKDDEEKSYPSIVHFPPEDVDAFIKRMKEMGMFYHFDTPIELNDLVILDPNWLVEGMKGVVTIKEAKKLKKENPMHATNPQWREFLSSGVITSQLLELIASVYWKGNEEWKSYFMNLLQQQSLLYRIPDRGDGEVKYVVPPLLPKICNGSLPPISEFLTLQLERSYPPLEVYKLAFGLVKRRGWSYDSRSTRYSILLLKEFEIEKVTLIGVSCDSSGMRQELSISILEQHKNSSLGEAVMDDLLSESPSL